MEPLVKVFCILVTFNGEKWIRKCINSLYGSRISVEIVLIDNNSTDKTVDIIRSEYPGVCLEVFSENIGFGRANNFGIRKALVNGADYIFLLNQDAWVKSDTLEKLIQIQRNHEKYGILSPIHLNGNGSGLDAKFNSYLRRDQGKKLIDDLLGENRKLMDVYSFQFINAAAWLISRACIESVGAFDPIFTHYGEDNDYLNRCFYHGYKLGVVPNAYIYHDREKQVKLLDQNICVDTLYINSLKYLKVIDSNFAYRYRAFKIAIWDKILYTLLRGNFSKSLIYFQTYQKIKNNSKQIENNINISIQGSAFNDVN